MASGVQVTAWRLYIVALMPEDIILDGTSCHFDKGISVDEIVVSKSDPVHEDHAVVDDPSKAVGKGFLGVNWKKVWTHCWNNYTL